MFSDINVYITMFHCRVIHWKIIKYKNNIYLEISMLYFWNIAILGCQLGFSKGLMTFSKKKKIFIA